jgi:hypothetical protein
METILTLTSIATPSFWRRNPKKKGRGLPGTVTVISEDAESFQPEIASEAQQKIGMFRGNAFKRATVEALFAHQR